MHCAAGRPFRVDPLFSAEEFGGHDGSQGQRAAVLDRVFQSPARRPPIRRSRCGCPGRRLRARSGFRSGRRAPLRCVRCGWRRVRFPERRLTHPCLPARFSSDSLGQRDCRAARGVLLLGVVHLLDAHVVAAHAVDHRGQLPVEAEHQVHAQTVVRGVEQRPAPLAAQLLQLRRGGRSSPSCRSPPPLPLSMQVRMLAVGRRGRGELQRDVDARQMCGVEFAVRCRCR